MSRASRLKGRRGCLVATCKLSGHLWRNPGVAEFKFAAAMNPDSNTDLASLLWFYSVNQAVAGPVSFQELASLFQSGTLPPDVLAVPEGREDWRPFTEWQVSQRQSPPLTAASKVPPTGFSGEAANAAGGLSGASQERGGIKATRQRKGRRKGCGGCLVLIAACLLFGLILETCSKPDLTLSESERQNPKEAVQKLMKGVYGGDLRETEAHVIFDGVATGKLNVYVRVNADMRYSKNLFDLEQKLTKAFQTLYTSGLPIWEVVIWNYGELVNKYGNESDEIVHKCSLHSNEAAQVNWQNAEYISLERIWEVRFKHAVMQ